MLEWTGVDALLPCANLRSHTGGRGMGFLFRMHRTHGSRCNHLYAPRTVSYTVLILYTCSENTSGS